MASIDNITKNIPTAIVRTRLTVKLACVKIINMRVGNEYNHIKMIYLHKCCCDFKPVATPVKLSSTKKRNIIS